MDYHSAEIGCSEGIWVLSQPGALRLYNEEVIEGLEVLGVMLRWPSIWSEGMRLSTKCWVSALSDAVRCCQMLSDAVTCPSPGFAAGERWGCGVWESHRLKQFSIVFLGAELWPNGHELRWCSECGFIWGRSVNGQDKERQYLQRISEYNSSGITGITGGPGRPWKAMEGHPDLFTAEARRECLETAGANRCRSADNWDNWDILRSVEGGLSLEKAVRDLPSTKIIPISK